MCGMIFVSDISDKYNNGVHKIGFIFNLDPL